MAVAQNAADGMADRLHDFTYNETECQAAIRGEKIPHALGQPLIRRCIIIADPEPGAYLSGDTAVCRSLNVK